MFQVKKQKKNQHHSKNNVKKFNSIVKWKSNQQITHLNTKLTVNQAKTVTKINIGLTMSKHRLTINTYSLRCILKFLLFLSLKSRLIFFYFKIHLSN